MTLACHRNSFILLNTPCTFEPRHENYVLWAYRPVCVGSWWEILKTGFVTTRLIYQPCWLAAKAASHILGPFSDTESYF